MATAFREDDNHHVLLVQQTFPGKELSKKIKVMTHHVKALETLVSRSNKVVEHNNIVINFLSSDMQEIDNFKRDIMGLHGSNFPTLDMKDAFSPFLFYNYALLFCRLKYFHNSVTILQKLLASIHFIKDMKLAENIVLLLMEANMCTHNYEETLNIARNYGDIVRDKELRYMYHIIASTAQIWCKKVNCTLKTDVIENIQREVMQLYKSGQRHKALCTNHLYYTLKYELSSQGVDIAMATCNSLLVIYLSVKNPFAATLHFKIAANKHLLMVKHGNSKRMDYQDMPFSLINFGSTLLYVRNIEDAFQCFLEAARQSPDDPNVWKCLADCCVFKSIFEPVHYERIVEARVIKSNHIDYSAKAFVIPKCSLEFGNLCLSNALYLTQTIPKSSLYWIQHCEFRNFIYLMQCRMMLMLQDPLSAMLIIKKLLKQPHLQDYCIYTAGRYAIAAAIDLCRRHSFLH